MKKSMHILKYLTFLLAKSIGKNKNTTKNPIQILG